MRCGLFDEAICAYKKLVSYGETGNHNLLEGYINLGKSLVYLKNYHESVSYFQKAISISHDPDLSEINPYYGFALNHLGKYMESAIFFKRFIKTKEGNISISDLYNFTVSMIMWRGLENTLSYIDNLYEKLIEIYQTNSEDIYALYGLGVISALRDEKSKALEYLDSAILNSSEVLIWMKYYDIIWDKLGEIPELLDFWKGVVSNSLTK